jgi:hypothetical protein
MRQEPTSAPLPKFVIHRRTLGHELRKQRGAGKFMILVPLFDLKFLNELATGGVGNFKSAALALVDSAQGANRICNRAAR